MLAMLLHSCVLSLYTLSLCFFLLDCLQIFFVNSMILKKVLKIDKFFHEMLSEAC
jgi:hypothetical protein